MTATVFLTLLGYFIGCFALERAEDCADTDQSAHVLLIIALLLLAMAGARLGAM